MSAVEHHVIVNDNGSVTLVPADMRIPVECGNCGQVYDLCAGVPLQRYMDCTVFRTPCCGHVTDDRPQGWCEGRGFRRLSIPTTHEAKPAPEPKCVWPNCDCEGACPAVASTQERTS